MRQLFGNDVVTQTRFSGILSRLMRQKAVDMGRDSPNDYIKFCIEELNKNSDVLP